MEQAHQLGAVMQADTHGRQSIHQRDEEALRGPFARLRVLRHRQRCRTNEKDSYLPTAAGPDAFLTFARPARPSVADNSLAQLENVMLSRRFSRAMEERFQFLQSAFVVHDPNERHRAIMSSKDFAHSSDMVTLTVFLRTVHRGEPFRPVFGRLALRRMSDMQ
jgi:hypothetical protein